MKTKRSKNVETKTAAERVQAFAAAGNFPKEKAGVQALADALERAACDTGMTMQAIVDECLDSSAWCPTPFDLRGVALSMRDKARHAKEGSIHAAWEHIYGPPQPDWAAKLLGVLVGAPAAETKMAMHTRAIRDMLFYIEGDGREQGDRQFWKDAQKHDLRDHAALVEQIRSAGGWQTERDLQGKQQPASTAGSGDAWGETK